ncbi:MAG: type II toxin-antitoxin system death-on-curing family toxin [Solirubrobacteraceae bacterium]
MIHLDLDEILHIAERTIGGAPVIRDQGLLQSALARPQASAFGEDAYQTIHDQTAALLHSVARNHALVDGNKRLGLAAVIAFYGMNGLRLTLTNEDAYQLVMRVARGDLDDVALIAQELVAGTTVRA